MKCKLGDEGQKVSWDFLLSTKGEDVSASYLVAEVVPLDVGLMFDVGWRSIYNPAACQYIYEACDGAPLVVGSTLGGTARVDPVAWPK